MMEKTLRLLLVFLGVVVLSACSSTILEPIDVATNSYSVDAKQRFVISVKKNGKQIVCAEPSPDALVAIAQAASAQGALAGKGSVGVSFSSSESAASMGIRTATIQLLRDALYRACEAYLNGAVDEFGYGLILSSIDDVMVSLMGIEGLTGMQRAAQVALGGETKTTSKSSEKSKTDKKRPAPQPEGGSGGAPPAPGSESSRTTDSAAEGSTETKSTSTIESVTERKVDASSAGVVSKAVEQITKKDPAGTSVVGACLMWLSNHQTKNEDLKTLCTDVVSTSFKLPPVTEKVLLKRMDLKAAMKKMALKAAIERAAKCQAEIMKAKKGEFDQEKAAYCKKLDDEAKKL